MAKRLVQPYYEASLYIGSEEGYGGGEISYERLIGEISEYQKSSNLNITSPVRVTRTEFVFLDYREEGWEITAINYPRYPRNPVQLTEFIEGLGEFLMERLKQVRVSIIFPDRIVMLEADNQN